MRMLKIAPLALALTFSASTAYADVELSWTGCSRSEYENEAYTAGDHVLTVSIGGYEGDFNSVDLTLMISDRCSSNGNFIPAAWRFDPAGCQAGALRVEHPASFGGCAGLVPNLAFELVSTATLQQAVGPDQLILDYAAVMVRILSSFPPTHLSAANRYIVARVHFDMTNTVAGADPTGKACGCGSAEREISLMSGRLGSAEGEFPLRADFSAPWNGYGGCAIAAKRLPRTEAEPGPDPSCLTTDSRGTSWGRIKAQYR